MDKTKIVILVICFLIFSFITIQISSFMIKGYDMRLNHAYDVINFNYILLKDRIDRLEKITPMKELTQHIDKLEQDNRILRDQLSQVMGDLTRVSREKETLRAKVASLSKAPQPKISQPKEQKKSVSVTIEGASQKDNNAAFKKAIETGASNKGYLMRNGQSTN